MTAPAIKVLQARAQARATLFAAGDLDLHEAVDPLQDAAVSYGLVDALEQDRVQSILADSFAGVR